MELVLIMQITGMEMDKAWKRAEEGGESHFKVIGIFLDFGLTCKGIT